MPSLIRFIVISGVIAGAVYGGFYALAVFFEPEPKEIAKPLYGIEIQKPK